MRRSIKPPALSVVVELRGRAARYLSARYSKTLTSTAKQPISRPERPELIIAGLVIMGRSQPLRLTPAHRRRRRKRERPALKQPRSAGRSFRLNRRKARWAGFGLGRDEAAGGLVEGAVGLRCDGGLDTGPLGIT
jgi:hypothetical protein